MRVPRAHQRTGDRVRTKRFSVGVFVMTFVVLGILTTVQSQILRAYIDYDHVPTSYRIIMAVYWLIVAAAFTLLTRWQIIRNYEQPMKRLAEATKAVASGDFSVYVRPLHTIDRADYLDLMIHDFNTMVAELGSIETLKTEFLSNVSHELRTPLSVIQSYAELLARGGVSQSQQQEYASAIRESTKKLSGLVTNILRLNRLEQQVIQSSTTRFDLSAQLSESALQFETMWEEKGLTFEADLEDSVIVDADADLLELVWNNLLSNAIKFTDSGGTLRLIQGTEGDEVIVSISDTGCGMSAETLKHIFEKFYQADSSHAGEGNGLGLSLVRRVVQICGGTIQVISTIGEGTTFTVRLPLTSVSDVEKRNNV